MLDEARTAVLKAAAGAQMHAKDDFVAAVYVASPLGFTESGRAYYEGYLLPLLVEARFRVLDPWEAAKRVFTAMAEHKTDDCLALAEANTKVGRSNADFIQESDCVLAVLDGPDVASGTDAEIGYAAARGVPIVGLHTDMRRTGDNAAAIVNRQVEYFVVRSGGRIVQTAPEAVNELLGLTRCRDT